MRIWFLAALSAEPEPWCAGNRGWAVVRKAADSVADFRPGTPALSGTFTRTVPLGSAAVEHSVSWSGCERSGAFGTGSGWP